MASMPAGSHQSVHPPRRTSDPASHVNYIEEQAMRKIISTLWVLTFIATADCSAAQPDTGARKQTTRMGQCSSTAKEKGLKGDARREYMRSCLRSPDTRAAAQACDAAATEKGLNGSARKDYLRDCIKSKRAGTPS
jgi:hypothetical protein